MWAIIKHSVCFNGPFTPNTNSDNISYRDASSYYFKKPKYSIRFYPHKAHLTSTSNTFTYRVQSHVVFTCLQCTYSQTGFFSCHQAFSHFTFERSGHELIVVDIQGVGDLWTDPQIHTREGTEYGDGNLGTHGMALFFHSHVCNDICKTFAMSKFDMAPSEQSNLKKFLKAKVRDFVFEAAIYGKKCDI